MAEARAIVPLFSADTIRKAEKPLLDAGEPLMRRAAAALAAVAHSELASAGERIPSGTQVRRPRVLVLAGPGDNGGDALYAAVELTAEADVDVLLVSDRFHEAAFAAALAAGVRRVEMSAARDSASAYTLILDGIVGIGASAALRGTAREAVRLLRPRAESAGTSVVAVDLPSGVDPDTGAHDDVVLPASVTVTFGGVKAGLVGDDGAPVVGRVILVDLGLDLPPDDAVGSAEISAVVSG
ncbi:NAD(P)H-hydrate epimerase [Microbacterium sp. NPDC077184]|uniref:NAD(P)H-hydrate epimerase n=1 Tax=Microbacterium sp. NPDC077184 TaxID=3154764 RepID=UPI003444FE58